MLVSALGQLGFQRVHVMALSLAASNALTPSSLSKHDIVTLQVPSTPSPFPDWGFRHEQRIQALKCAIDFLIQPPKSPISYQLMIGYPSYLSPDSFKPEMDPLSSESALLSTHSHSHLANGRYTKWCLDGPSEMIDSWS